MQKAIILLSGGLDSTTVSAIAKNQNYELYGLSFDYGQRHKSELEVAKKTSKRFCFKEHKIIKSGVGQFGGSALTTDIAVPKDKKIEDIGKEIPITQSGTKLKYIGKVVLSKDGNIYTDLVAEVPQKNGATKDEKIEASINQIKSDLAATLEKKYGESSFDMNALDENNKWYVRSSERNIANFLTDAFRTVMKTDIAIINGGGIRANLKAGDITFNDILTVQPFNNKLYAYQISGQTILDELEFGVRKLPEMFGGIMHTAGLTYKVNTGIPSSVVVNEKGFFTG